MEYPPRGPRSLQRENSVSAPGKILDPEPSARRPEHAGIPGACDVRSCAAESVTGPGVFFGLLSLDGTLRQAECLARGASPAGADPVIGCPFWSASWWAWTPAVQRRVRQAVAGAAAGAQLRYREQALGPRGRLFTVHLAFVPVAARGVVTALIVSVVDISPDPKNTEPTDPDRSVALATFVDRLAVGTGVQEVVRTVAESAPQVVGAVHCRLALWDPCRDLLVAPTWPRHRERIARPPGPESSPFAVKDPAPVVSVVLGASQNPGGQTRQHFERRIVVAGSTLYEPPGDLYAALDLVWAGSPQLGPDDVARLGNMADLTATALRRALVSEVQGDLARALQRPRPVGTPGGRQEESVPTNREQRLPVLHRAGHAERPDAVNSPMPR